MSCLSRKSLSIVVEKVLESPAFIPLGGSFVTLIAICSNPIGNSFLGSQVSQSLKSSSISASGVKMFSIWAMKSSPKWQLYRITQFPWKKLFCIASLAIFSWPSPILTFSMLCLRLRLASSSIEEVGSAPAVRRNKTGTLEWDSSQICSTVSVTGATNSGPSMCSIKSRAHTVILSSFKDRIKVKWMNLPMSFSELMVSLYLGTLIFSEALLLRKASHSCLLSSID
mmetsp:Transcript_1316/g.2077  ORF Transcript_1316/g.2077 Transcript_1316/m.2077 type:complete len:226 (+) Transcript_1316:1468-2145(+)